MTNSPTYSRQCKTCNAPEGVQTLIISLFNELGPKYTEISRRVGDTYGFQVGPDALTTHLNTHIALPSDEPTDETTVAPILGVRNAS